MMGSLSNAVQQITGILPASVVIDGKFKMLGRQPVHERHCIFKIFDNDDRAIGRPALPCHGAGCQSSDLSISR